MNPPPHKAPPGASSTSGQARILVAFIRPSLSLSLSLSSTKIFRKSNHVHLVRARQDAGPSRPRPGRMRRGIRAISRRFRRVTTPQTRLVPPVTLAAHPHGRSSRTDGRRATRLLSPAVTLLLGGNQAAPRQFLGPPPKPRVEPEVPHAYHHDRDEVRNINTPVPTVNLQVQ